jgi:hypothetical protein
MFIAAKGGCGKTFLEKAILTKVRSLEAAGCVALAMATTGIAGTLLPLGRTFHSRLKAPLKPEPQSMLRIASQSSLAKLVRMAKLLLVDEATMLHRHLLEALDRTLQDLTGNEGVPFGGKVVVLGGNFNQCLPVVARTSRAGIAAICLNQSPLWQHFKVINHS